MVQFGGAAAHQLFDLHSRVVRMLVFVLARTGGFLASAGFAGPRTLRRAAARAQQHLEIGRGGRGAIRRSDRDGVLRARRHRGLLRPRPREPGGHKRAHRTGRRRRRGRRPVSRTLDRRVAANLEDDLHVVLDAPAADTVVKMILAGRGDKVVVLTGSEFEAAGLRRERPECDGDVHTAVRLITDGDDTGILALNGARLVFVLRHIVNDVLLGVVFVGAWWIQGADDVHLVVLIGHIVLIHVYDVVRVVYPKHWIR